MSAAFIYTQTTKNYDDHKRYDEMTIDIKATRHQVMVIAAKMGAYQIPELEKQRRLFRQMGVDGWNMARDSITEWIDINHTNYSGNYIGYMLALKVYGNTIIYEMSLDASNALGRDVNKEFERLHEKTFPRFILRMANFVRKYYKYDELPDGWKFDLSENVFEKSLDDWKEYLDDMRTGKLPRKDKDIPIDVAIIDRRDYTKRLEYRVA